MSEKGKKYFQEELVDLQELKKLEDKPLFYHPDECDCITCHARTEKGGLDHDPSNDDEEFEEHERQVFRDVGITKTKKRTTAKERRDLRAKEQEDHRKRSEEEKPKLSIIGEDGNVFFILGKAIREARRAGWNKERIEKFKKDAMSGDYNNVLRLCMEHFDVV